MAIIRKRHSRYATASGEIGSHSVQLRGDVVFDFSVGQFEVYLSEKELREAVKQWRKQAKELGVDLEVI